MEESKKQIIIIYDKDCYLCSNFQAYLELKKKFEIQFVDLNSNPDIVQGYEQKGFTIQNGMVLDLDGQIFQGEQAVMQIQKLLGGNTWFDKLLSYCMQSPLLVSLGYPIAHFIRSVLLWRRRNMQKK